MATKKKMMKKEYRRESESFFLMYSRMCQKKVLILPKQNWIRCMVLINIIWRRSDVEAI